MQFRHRTMLMGTALGGFLIGRGTNDPSQGLRAARSVLEENCIPVQQSIIRPQSSSSSSSSIPSKNLLILKDNETDPWKIEHYGRLDRVRKKCGDLCSINDLDAYRKLGSHTPGNAYSTFSTPVDCNALFEMEEIDAGDTKDPSYPIPEELLDLYSLHGGIDIRYYGSPIKESYLNGKAEENIWTIKRIKKDLKLLQNGKLEGSYQAQQTNIIRDQLIQFIQSQGYKNLKGKSVLVVGSQRPWIETIALYARADNVTTLEYGKIKSNHPKIFTLTPAEFRQQYLKGTLPQYDVVLTYSSLEHSGLGRYGDALNPWGDILSLARCWCVTRPNGFLMLGIPNGPDLVHFNAHRVYGNVRMPLLTTNWIPADNTTNFEIKKEAWKTLGVHGLYFFRKGGGAAGEQQPERSTSSSSTARQ